MIPPRKSSRARVALDRTAFDEAAHVAVNLPELVPPLERLRELSPVTLELGESLVELVDTPADEVTHGRAGLPAGAALGDDCRDLREREAECLRPPDEVELFDRLIGVESVSALRAPDGPEQPL